MNSSQRNVVVVASLISLLMMLFVPFRIPSSSQPLKYDFILAVFEPGQWYISVMDLLIQFGIVWAVAALMIAVLRQPN